MNTAQTKSYSATSDCLLASSYTQTQQVEGKKTNTKKSALFNSRNSQVL